jgi:GLPGLI family protein
LSSSFLALNQKIITMYSRKTKFILGLAIILSAPVCLAQDFQGKAFYKTSREVNFTMDSASFTPERQAAMNEMIRKQFSKEYTLVFDQQESLYKELAQLDGPSQGGAMVIVTMSDASGELYKNTKKKKYTAKRDLLGKEFLVKDELKEIEWKLASETKQIGQYTCYKATTTKTIERMVVMGEDDEQQPEEPRTIDITAWYTPEIPVASGPDRFWGLPGLILEINEGKSKILCSKVILNPDEVVEITEPAKGKVMNEEEFTTMMAAKMQEMEKMNNGGKKQEGAHQMKITIDN